MEIKKIDMETNNREEFDSIKNQIKKKVNERPTTEPK